jgi:hypothetical protein
MCKSVTFVYVSCFAHGANGIPRDTMEFILLPMCMVGIGVRVMFRCCNSFLVLFKFSFPVLYFNHTSKLYSQD